MARTARTRMSRAGMRVWLDRWERSGLSAAGFCRRHRIREQRLAYWKRALSRAARGGAKDRGSRRAGFAPIRLADLTATVMAGSLEVVLSSGDRLVLREGVPVQLVRDTLAALRERC